MTSLTGVCCKIRLLCWNIGAFAFWHRSVSFLFPNVVFSKCLAASAGSSNTDLQVHGSDQSKQAGFGRLQCCCYVLFLWLFVIFNVKCLICHVHAALSPVISSPVSSHPILPSPSPITHFIFPSGPELTLHHAFLLTQISHSLSQRKQLCPNYSVMSVFILYSLLFKDINNKNKHNTSQGSVVSCCNFLLQDDGKISDMLKTFKTHTYYSFICWNKLVWYLFKLLPAYLVISSSAKGRSQSRISQRVTSSVSNSFVQWEEEKRKQRAARAALAWSPSWREGGFKPGETGALTATGTNF